MAEEKKNKKYGIRKILQEVIENELQNTEVIVKDELDDLKYENLQSIAEVLTLYSAGTQRPTTLQDVPGSNDGMF